MMRRKSMTLRGIAIVVLWLAAFACFGQAEEAEETLESWTSSAGTVVEAEYVGMKDGMVQLRTADGKILGITPDNLSQESRERLDELAGDDFNLPPPPNPNALLEASREFFDVQFSRKGPSGTIWIKQDGQRLPHAFKLGSHVSGREESMRRPRRLRGKGTFQEPEVEGDQVTYFMSYEYGVTARWTFSVEEKGIRAWFTVLSIDPGHKHGGAALHIGMPRIGKETQDQQGGVVMVAEPYLPTATLPKFLEWAGQHTLVFFKPKGDRTPRSNREADYNQPVSFARSYKMLPLPTSKIEIRGPAFAERTIILDTALSTRSWFSSGTYSSFTPWSGMTFYFSRENSDRENDKANFWFTVE